MTNLAENEKRALIQALVHDDDRSPSCTHNLLLLHEVVEAIIDAHIAAHHPVCRCAPDCAERIACQTVGDMGHFQCGWCDEHRQARHCCGCMVNRTTADPTLTQEAAASAAAKGTEAGHG